MAKEHEGISEVATASSASTTEASEETDKVSESDINIVVDTIQPNVPPGIKESMSTTEGTRGTKRPLPVDFESEFDWLYSRQKSSKKLFFCKVCELFKPASAKGVESPFIGGTELGDHPHRKLSKHGKSNIHEEAVKKYVQYKSKETCSISRHASTNADIARNQKYIDCLTDTVYLAVKKHWALDSVSDLMEHKIALLLWTIKNSISQSIHLPFQFLNVWKALVHIYSPHY